MSRCALFRNKQVVQRPNPLTDGINFIEYETEEEIVDGYPVFKGTNVDELMTKYLSGNLEDLYNIYVNGYNHCMNYFTEAAVAKYVLDVIQKHDWNEKTSHEVK